MLLDTSYYEIVCKIINIIEKEYQVEKQNISSVLSSPQPIRQLFFDDTIDLELQLSLSEVVVAAGAARLQSAAEAAVPLTLRDSIDDVINSLSPSTSSGAAAASEEKVATIGEKRNL